MKRTKFCMFATILTICSVFTMPLVSCSNDSDDNLGQTTVLPENEDPGKSGRFRPLRAETHRILRLNRSGCESNGAADPFSDRRFFCSSRIFVEIKGR